ncbi:MAG: insulinase family protein [Alphaproteobacteria bacterium]|nr:insulinase family protein [Alphaproteobacteria bacterium]
MIEDHSLPIVALDAIFKVGSYNDPKGKHGLALLVSGLLDEGSGEFDSQKFRQTLANHAIDIHFDASIHEFTASLKTTSEHKRLAFDLMSNALKSPRFDDEPVDRIKNQLYTIIKNEEENLYGSAVKEWREKVFPNHPYSRSSNGSIKDLKSITKDDLRNFAETKLSKNKLVIGVNGDITPKELHIALDELFADLPNDNGLSDAKDIEPITTGEVYIKNKKIPQSIIVFGHKGIKRTDKDFYPAYVMNYVLGAGSFSSRLMEEVRVKRGLAYGISTHLSLNKYAPLITGVVGTRNDKAGETVKVIRNEWKKMANDGITQKELDNAKSYLIGSFPLRFDSTESIAGMLAVMQVEKLPIDFLDKRNSYVEAVTVDDIKRVASKMLSPEKLTISILGIPEGLRAKSK